MYRRRLLHWILAAAALLAIAVALIVQSSSAEVPDDQRPASDARPTPAINRYLTIAVGRPTDGRQIPPGFVGLSLEFPALQAYQTRAPYLFAQLVRNLTPGQAPVLKVGGDSTDWAWWPVRGMRRPPGVRYTLGPRWLEAARSLAQTTDARLILGIDLEANSRRVAATEARAFIAGLGRARIKALELGNEPELYGSWGWYRAADGHEVPGRPRSWDFASYVHNFTAIAAALPHVALAGPAIGAPGWMQSIGRLIAAEPRLSLITLHRYPLQRCFMPAASPAYPTIHNLLSPQATVGLASGIARYVALAHARGIRLRVDELNSVSCGGAPGVSNTFASALWVLDESFQMARVGVDGINVHTFPGAWYQPFDFRHAHGGWQALVYPEYYGLMAFSLAAPPGSLLLHVSGATGPHLHAWATLAAGGRVHVVVINFSRTREQMVAVRFPSWARFPVGARALATGSATLERLIAPGIRARSGVTLGGRGFGSHTTTAVLEGAPRLTAIRPVGGEYLLRVPAASAALLMLPAS